MTIKGFAKKVLAEIKNRADGELRVQVVEKEQTNGVKFIGISILGTDKIIGPCIYIRDYYEAYCAHEITVEEAAESIYRAVQEKQEEADALAVKNFWNWEYMSERIYPKVINAEWNSKQLQKIPHRLFLDFAVVYYAKVDEWGDHIGTIQIKNGHLKIWGRDEAELHEKAMENLKAEHAFIENIINFIPECMLQQEDNKNEVEAYVLSNQKRYFGAAELLDTSALEEIYRKIGDFVALPSSLHELFIIPDQAEGDEGYKVLTEMVKDVNQNHVSQEEWLSEHVYVYRNDGQGLRIAA